MYLNPNSAGGLMQPAFFSDGYFNLNIKIKVLEGPNFLTFPKHLWTTPLYPFGSIKLLKKGILDHFYQWLAKILDPEIKFFSLF